MLDGSPVHSDEANVGNVENNNPAMVISSEDGVNTGSKPRQALLKKGGGKLRSATPLHHQKPPRNSPVICLSDHNNNTVAPSSANKAATQPGTELSAGTQTVLTLHHLKHGVKKELLKSKGAAQPGGQTARNLPRHDQVNQNVNARNHKPKHGQSPAASHPTKRDSSSPNKPPSLHHPPLREKKKPLHASNKMKILRISPVETSPEYLKDEAAFGQQSFISVGLGDDAALHCADLRNNQGQCQYMTWLFSNTMKKKVTFFKNGNFKNARSGRLSVTENCSLVIKKVTVEDGGVYTCRLSDKSRPRQGPGEQFVLSVITATTAAAEATTSAVATELATTTKASNTSSKLQALALFFLLIVFIVALVITVVVLRRYKKRKGNKTQMNENDALSLNPSQPQSGPETSQDTTDPEDGVSYASISFTKKTDSKVQVQNQVDEDEAVMYSTVKVSSASTRASIDLSSLYAAINKRQK